MEYPDFYGRYQFVKAQTPEAVVCIVILVTASALGSFGNFLIFAAIFRDKSLHTIDSIFICNLAISDSYVTLLAIPFSIVAKVEGEQFFDGLPGLCKTIASACTVSCVTSLTTIGLMSVNRYVYICKHEQYERIFTKWNSICMCISLYFVGGIFVLLNTADIGDHGYDRKSMECMWDRMASYPYTVVFSVALVWLPSVVIGACYLKIYLYVAAQRKRMAEHKHVRNATDTRHVHLAKTLFVIYAVFITCWAPYALVIVIDYQDRLPHLVHLYVSMFAHLHPSLNWLVYYITNTKFSKAYKELFQSFGRYFSRTNTITPHESAEMIEVLGGRRASVH